MRMCEMSTVDTFVTWPGAHCCHCATATIVVRLAFHARGQCGEHLLVPGTLLGKFIVRPV